jgi:hypothetical protein
MPCLPRDSHQAPELLLGSTSNVCTTTLSGTNPTTIVALAFGAISVASAMFLILDLTQPYSGLFRVPPSAIQQTLDAIDN